MCDSTQYFVIFIESEGSYSTVPESDVIYDDSVTVGDTVVFFWNKKKHEGVIKYISEDYDACHGQAVKLSHKEKKANQLSDSFHEDRPRKSAVQCQEKMSLNKRKVSSKSGPSRPNKNKKIAVEPTITAAAKAKTDMEVLDMLRKRNLAVSRDRKKKIEEIFGDSDSGDNGSKKAGNGGVAATHTKHEEEDHHSSSTKSDSDSTSDSSSDDATDDAKKARKLSAKLAAKFNLATLEKLAASLLEQGKSKSGSSNPIKRLHGQPSSSHTGLEAKADEASEVEMATVSFPSDSMPENDYSVDSETNAGDVADKNHNESTVKIKNGSTNNNNNDEHSPRSSFPRPTQAGLQNMYRGDMFLVENPTEGKALDENKTIWCVSTNYEAALEKSKSATMAGRKLLEGVFTLEAIKACSISGMPPRGKGKDAYVNNRSAIKPFLDPKAVKAIIDEVLQMQKVRHWKPKKDAGQIRQAMAVRMNELQQRESQNQ